MSPVIVIDGVVGPVPEGCPDVVYDAIVLPEIKILDFLSGATADDFPVLPLLHVILSETRRSPKRHSHPTSS